MEPAARSRREVARELGLTYSTLRVYERHLGELLSLSQGPNRTTLYPEAAVRMLREAISLKQGGLPFSKLADYFRGHLSPLGAVEEATTLDRIRDRTEEILSIGQRLEEKLLQIERSYLQLLAARRRGEFMDDEGERHAA